VYDSEGEKLQFGKEDSEERVPALGMGLLRGEGGERLDDRQALRERFARGERIGGDGRGRGRERRRERE